MTYKDAKGVFPWQPGDEPAEITVRRHREGDPFWVWVDQWLPPTGAVVKATDGFYVADAHITLIGEWSYIGDNAGPVIAWLYEPPIPPAPTRKEYQEYLAEKE